MDKGIETFAGKGKLLSSFFRALNFPHFVTSTRKNFFLFFTHERVFVRIAILCEKKSSLLILTPHSPFHPLALIHFIRCVNVSFPSLPTMGKVVRWVLICIFMLLCKGKRVIRVENNTDEVFRSMCPWRSVVLNKDEKSQYRGAIFDCYDGVDYRARHIGSDNAK